MVRRAVARRPSTVADYKWRLENHLLPFFERHTLSAITIAEVDRYKAHKLAEGELSGESINKTLKILAAVLEVAVERELIARNPATGKRRRVKVTAPRRSYLDTAGQIAALLDAARDSMARLVPTVSASALRDDHDADVRRAAYRRTTRSEVG